MKPNQLLVLLAGLSLGGLSAFAGAPAASALPVSSAVAEFMTDYGRQLPAGDPAALLPFYAARGTLVLANGVDELMTPAQAAGSHRTNWPTLTTFAWEGLDCREMSPGVATVSGWFEAAGAHYHYSATVVREGAAWKIRSEAVFAAPSAAATTAGGAPGSAEAATPAAPAGPNNAEASTALSKTEKTAADKVLSFVRAYEPVQLGLTKDEGDEMFMDFTLSLMFPVVGGYWDGDVPEAAQWQVSKWFYAKHSGVFFSGTVRAGQYIAGRPSAPVVEKRFNPQLFWRYWVPDGKGKLAEHRYLDFIFYGHESNGQAISTEETFNQQAEIYRKLEDHPDSPQAYARSRLSARDTISRGWDYVGLEASWTADNQHILRMKVREFLPGGILQKGAEQSHDWEGYGPTHPRRQYDGLMLQYTGFGAPIPKFATWLTGRYTFTYTTGLSHPGRYSTFQLDLGAEIVGRPVSFWLRSGYNSDLIDYFRHDSSVGAGISIWSFTRGDAAAKPQQ